MNSKISIYNIKGISISMFIVGVNVFIHISQKEYIVGVIFLTILFGSIYTCINMLYVENLKKTILEDMNLKNEEIYRKIYAWGILTYVPVIILLIISPYKNMNTIFNGSILIFYNVINMIILKLGYNKILSISLFAIILIISIILFMGQLVK